MEFYELKYQPQIVPLSSPDTPLLKKETALLCKDLDHSQKMFLRGLYEDEKSSDFIITSQGKKFFCHKIVLQQYSYFKEIIDTAKKGDSIIYHEIPTELCPDPDLLSTLLQYSYLGVLNSPDSGKEISLLNASRALTFHDAARRIRSWMGTYLSPSQAFQILEYAFQKKHTYLYGVLVRLIGPHATQIFENDLHLQFSLENLRFLLMKGELWISELKLFQSVIRWCKHRVKNPQYPNPQQLTYEEYFKTHFSDVIRYVLIGVRAFSEHVEPTGLVPDHLVYETYRYFVTPDGFKKSFFGKKYHIGNLLRGFSIFRFRFSDRENGSFVLLKDEGREIGLSKNASRTIVSDLVIKYPSVYYFEFLFVKSGATSYVMFGVSEASNPSKDQYLGNSKNGYAIYACNGNGYHNFKSFKFHKKFSANSKPVVVGVLLNMVSNPTKMFFYLDGKFIGKAFEGLELPLAPAISLANTQDVVRVVENPVPPASWKTDITK